MHPNRNSIDDKITRFVVKLSGSLFFSKDFEKVAEALKDIVSKKKDIQLILVAGGGKTAREYIDVASKFGTDQASLDEIGIQASRLNAMALIAALGSISCPRVPTTLSEVVHALESPKNRAVVLGGLHPGQSTNAVAALVAEKVRARRFINATDIEAVYTENPKRSKSAMPLAQVTTKELEKILAGESMKAGGYDLMDPIALKLIERSKIPTLITKCSPETLSESILEDKSQGTVILFS